MILNKTSMFNKILKNEISSLNLIIDKYNEYINLKNDIEKLDNKKTKLLLTLHNIGRNIFLMINSKVKLTISQYEEPWEYVLKQMPKIKKEKIFGDKIAQEGLKFQKIYNEYLEIDEKIEKLNNKYEKLFYNPIIILYSYINNAEIMKKIIEFTIISNFIDLLRLNEEDNYKNEINTIFEIPKYDSFDGIV